MPVFGDTMNAIQREAKNLNEAVSKDLEKQIADGADKGSKAAVERMEKNLEGGGEEAGKKAGKKYAGAFMTQLRTGLREANRELGAIELRTDDSEMREQLKTLRKEIRSINRTKITPDMDINALLGRVREVDAALAKLSESGKVDLAFNYQKALKDVSRARKVIESAVGNIEIGVDLRAADRQLGAFGKKFQSTMERAAKALGTSTNAEIRKVQAAMDKLADKRIGVDVSASEAMREVQLLRATLEGLANAGSLDIDATADAAQARAELIGLQEVMARIDGKTLQIKTDADIAAATAKLTLLARLFDKVGISQRSLRAHMDSSGNSFRAFNLIVLGVAASLPALIPIIGALGGALLALLPILAGVAAGLGVMMVGFSGIGSAVSALANRQKNARKEQEAYAKSVRNAGRSVADARRNLARTTQDAAQQQSDAARAVADAERAAADAIESALERRADAERALADAQRDAAQAQRDLRQARKEAQEDLDEAADRQRRNELDIRQAQIDLFNATVANDAAISDPGSTNLEREQASINLGVARERLHELREESEEIKKEIRRGVDGNDGVQAAEDALAAALQARADAARNLADAEEAVNEARIQGAQQVADALENQRRVQESSARSIADAKRNLVRAEQDYRDAVNETSASVENLRHEMGQLGPAGREFARFIYGLRDEAMGFRAAIQEAMLPGVQAGMQHVLGNGSEIQSFAVRMARTIGNLFENAGRTMTKSPVWRQFWGMLDELGPRLTRQFGETTLNWMGVFARLATIAAPWAEKLSDGLLKMSEAALEWVSSKRGTEVIENFLEYAFRMGPKVVDFLGALWRAGVNLGKALAPLGEILLNAFTAFLDWIGNMDPKDLGVIVTAIIALVVAFQAMTGIIALVTAGVGILSAVLAGGFLGTAIVIIGAIILIGGAFLALWTQCEWFRDAVTTVFEALRDASQWVWENVISPIFNYIRDLVGDVFQDIAKFWESDLKPALDAIGRIITWLWENIFRPVFGFIWDIVSWVFDKISWAWDKILWPVLDVMIRLVWKLWWGIFRIAFREIARVFEGVAKSLVWVWDNILKPMFDNFMDLIGTRLVNAFRDAVDNIKVLWAALKSHLAAPVAFFIHHVLNEGIIKGFNWVAKKVGADGMDPFAMPGWVKAELGGGGNRNPGGNGTTGNGVIGNAHTGGVVTGYTPGRDTQLIHVGGGEAILRPEATRALGTDWIHRLNRWARFGGVGAVRQGLGVDQGYAGAYAGGGIIPLAGARFSPHPTPYYGAWHAGDYNVGSGSADFGMPVRAWKDGVVAYLKSLTSSYGNHVVINHPDGNRTLYAHLSRFGGITGGQRVSQGQVIGYVGDTGNSFGPHLHFEIEGGPASIVEGGGGGLQERLLPGWAKALLGNGAGWLKDRIGLDGLMDHFGKFGDILTSTAKKLIEPVADKLGDMVTGWMPHNAPGRLALDAIRNLTGANKDVVSIVRELAGHYGWSSGGQWDALTNLIARESSWNPLAQNPDSTAFGLFQFLDSTWAGVGATKTSDPIRQTIAGLAYIRQRYGTPAEAIAFHDANNWYSEGGVVGEGDNGVMMYDNGGYLPPGLTTVLNLTGKPEPVFTDSQFAAMGQGRGAGGGDTIFDIDLNGTEVTAEDVASELLWAIQVAENGGVYMGANT